MRVRSHHNDSLGVDAFSNYITIVCDVLHHLIQSSTLHLLVLQVTERIHHEVKQYTTLAQLLNKQLLPVDGRGI